MCLPAGGHDRLQCVQKMEKCVHIVSKLCSRFPPSSFLPVAQFSLSCADLCQNELPTSEVWQQDKWKDSEQKGQLILSAQDQKKIDEKHKSDQKIFTSDIYDFVSHFRTDIIELLIFAASALIMAALWWYGCSTLGKAPPPSSLGQIFADMKISHVAPELCVCILQKHWRNCVYR